MDIINTANYKEYLAQISHQTGVYQMINAKGKVLYVGKAKDLQKRLASYFLPIKSDEKTKALLAQIVSIKTTITSSETEALLLEYNLIKTLKPHYNIVFKDNRSYPYIFIANQSFPCIDVYRGIPKNDGFYFGPFTNNQMLHEVISFLQKTFQIRSCRNSVFLNRSRPCLQYQMKRCAAPCVGNISQEEYGCSVEFIKEFLTNENSFIIEKIVKLMEKSSAAKDFEKAAFYRDQIANLKKAQLQQCIISDKSTGNIDILALQITHNICCIYILLVRKGLVLGDKNFIHQIPSFIELPEVIATFLVQYYSQYKDSCNIPQKIIVGFSLSKQRFIQDAVSKILNKKIIIVCQPKLKLYKQWLSMAENNSAAKLKQYIANTLANNQRFIEIKNVLNLDAIPQRIECFDVSHTFGEATVVSCVVFGVKGALKNQYRIFNIKNTNNDDYMALKEAIERHFMQIIKEKAVLPDILIIDGGKGQLNVAAKVLQNLQISKVTLMAIAKGKERVVGAEQIYIVGSDEPILLQSPVSLANENVKENSLLLNFLLNIRDEAHRFAVTGHRKQLIKNRTISLLESISGIGKKRCNILLKQFGGIEGVKAASFDELANIKGISEKLAKLIYEYLHM